ncbi:hypothetical protein BDY19DRAFT_996104 [Irpex rosettiformis]|uniref:Uncharacterized protein n=1 Tax=Irpex rosettiformis TaxID=378272 RepID=A0ACB8TW95_9APHY|nr:hypothetical protein BDY19DRAFT_996104 [Irpex rosettiformis]
MSNPSTPPPNGTGGGQDPQRNVVESPNAGSATSIRISSTFHFNANLDHVAPNTLILTPDRVLFVVHYHWLSAHSMNLFSGLLTDISNPTPDNLFVISVSERADVLNILLHAVYGLSCHNYAPTFQCLEETIEIFVKYGLTPIHHYVPDGSPIFNALLCHAPAKPIEVFALAASYRLEDLAVSSSSYTLNLNIYHISCETAHKIGSQYLQRLYSLHEVRMVTLKELLNIQPTIPPHRDTSTARHSVPAEDHTQIVVRAYHLAAVQVFYTASPAMSRARIESVMSRLINAITCVCCKSSLIGHVEDISERWSLVSRTI